MVAVRTPDTLARAMMSSSVAFWIIHWFRLSRTDLKQGDKLVFHMDHILAVRDIHRQECVAGRDVADLKELAQWIGRSGGNSPQLAQAVNHRPAVA